MRVYPNASGRVICHAEHAAAWDPTGLPLLIPMIIFARSQNVADLLQRYALASRSGHHHVQLVILSISQGFQG